MRFLIVDDDILAREMLRSCLGAIGECVLAPDGTRALELFQAAILAGRPFDMVFMDICMPGMDGHLVSHAMRSFEEERRLERRFTLVMVTASADEGDAELAASCNSSAWYVTKPVSAAELREMVGRLAGRRLGG